MNEVPPQSFGSWLKRRRTELDLTRPALAQLIACSVETIDKIEAGNRKPSEQVAGLLAECLNVPLEERSRFIEFARAELTAEQIAQLVRDGNGPAPWLAFHRSRHPNNLPALANSFIGRAREIEACSALLRRPEVRLLALTGPPGVGKTRLALRVASALIDHFTDGVFLVPLAPVADPALVIPTIARILGVRELARIPLLESLQTYLQDRQLLLLLDNFEQVIEAAPLVGQLLDAAPHLKVICTSRVVPHLYGEHDFQVSPLALPTADQMSLSLPLLPIESLAQYEAVRLFIERGQAANSGFELTEENASAVVEICRRLDGLPLAIELAASRIKLLLPQAILARLQSKLSPRLELLTGGARDLSSRQQTLRGAIEWGYDLLEEREKVLFRRLSVFAGGCTLEAAQAVCNAPAPEAERNGVESQEMAIGVLDSFAALIDNSLLRLAIEHEGVGTRKAENREIGEETRYSMLETIREYALEQLEASSEAEKIRQRHANFCLALVGEEESEHQGPESAVWLRQLETEHDNLRAALRWALESGHLEMGLRLSGALWRFWYQRGHFTEGRRWLAAFLSQAQEGEEDGAQTDRLRGTENYKTRDFKRETWARTKALIGAGTLAWGQGDLQAARSCFEESLALCRDLGDKQGSANALSSLGAVASGLGDYATSRSLREESLFLRRELGDKGGIACSLSNLGEVARCQGDYAAARVLYEESLAIRREMGHKNATGLLLHNMGHVALRECDFAQAAALFGESLTISAELGSKHTITDCIAGLAGVAGAQGEPSQAARLFGAAEALRNAISSVFAPADYIEYERNLASSRAQLGREVWGAAWEEGGAMNIEQATSYALAYAHKIEESAFSAGTPLRR